MAAIFRGPQNRIPERHNLPVAGAYLPGLVVTSDGETLTQAAAATGHLLILDIAPCTGNGTTVAYAAGDTGVAAQPVPGDTYAIRAAAGTYAVGDDLTVNASGQVAAAATGNPIVGYAAEGKTVTAGQLIDVTISDRLLA